MNYHNIKSVDLLNGSGLRTVLFVSGCSHNCPNCHNPQTHNPNTGVKFDKEALSELLRDLDHDYIDGLTFSGGDPLFPANRSEILSIAKKVRKLNPTKSIWMYTGYTYEYLISNEDPVIKDILNNLDVLIDGPFVMKLKDDKIHYRGSSNQRVIDVKGSLSSNSIVFLDL